MNPKNYSGGIPYPMRFPEEIVAEAKTASEKMQEPDLYVIRLACAIGLAHLKAINYELPQAVLALSPLVERAAKKKRRKSAGAGNSK